MIISCALPVILYTVSILSAQQRAGKAKPTQPSVSPPPTSAHATPTATDAQALPHAPAATKPWSLSSDTNILKAGESYTLPVRLSAADCTKDPSSNFVNLDSVTASTPASIVLKSPSFLRLPDNCTVAVPLTVNDDAPSGKDNLIFYTKSAADKPATIAGLLTVTIQNTKPLPPSPIPPGLTAQVDLMWKVLPRQAVADSYGDRVADGFFAVEATLGNNTGYDLQLAALGFDMPEFTCLPNSGAGDKLDTLPFPYQTKIPTMVPCFYSGDEEGFLWVSTNKKSELTVPVDAYPIVRGTVEREQFVGSRAIVINLVKSSGSVFVGVGSAYLNGTGGLFNPAVAIFGTTFEKGLELVWPDLTTNHLVALDNRR